MAVSPTLALLAECASQATSNVESTMKANTSPGLLRAQGLHVPLQSSNPGAQRPHSADAGSRFAAQHVTTVARGTTVELPSLAPSVLIGAVDVTFLCASATMSHAEQ